MADKSGLNAFERETRSYKAAHADGFRSVRQFPSLATVDARQIGDSNIILMQEAQPAAAFSQAKVIRFKLDDIASRFPPSLLGDKTQLLPLTAFRSAVLCKHAKARQERRAVSSLNASLTALPSRCGAQIIQPGVFKPTSVIEAKSAIQRKVTYDEQPFQDKPRSVRSQTTPLWSINNPTHARNDIRRKPLCNVPVEGPIKANRKYTQEFIRLSMEAYHVSRGKDE